MSAHNQRRKRTRDEVLETAAPAVSIARTNLSRAPRSATPPQIDRTKTCPFLLRLHWRSDRHNTIASYGTISKYEYPPNEVFIYSWEDATLYELTTLIQSTVYKAKYKHTKLSFASIAIRDGEFIMQHLGVVQSEIERHGKAPIDELSLKELGYEVGDCIDVAIIFPPKRK